MVAEERGPVLQLVLEDQSKSPRSPDQPAKRRPVFVGFLLTETVIVRGLSLGVPMRRMVTREILAGIVSGLALASITGPLVFWHWSDSRLAVAVSVSVLAAASTATGAAMALPWLFNSLRLDPAFGSGPLATVIQDLLSIWIYLSVTALVV